MGLWCKCPVQCAHKKPALSRIITSLRPKAPGKVALRASSLKNFKRGAAVELGIDQSGSGFNYNQPSTALSVEYMRLLSPYGC